MIVDAFMSIVLGVLTGVLGLVPAWDGPDLTGIGAGLGRGVEGASGYFPVGTLGACLGTVLLAKAALFGWRFVVFLYDKIPFKMT